MDPGRIKKIVRQNGERLILMENGQPEFVVMSFADYERLRNGEAEHDSGADLPPQTGVEAAELVTPEGSAPEETEFVVAGESAEEKPRPQIRVEDIRLEDLPL